MSHLSTLMANARHAARTQETVTIGGGIFTPDELKAAALEHEQITLNDPNPVERRSAMTVAVEVRNVYGQDKIYPDNDQAKLFASLTGNKTLTLRDLNHIQALGFEVVEIHKKRLPI